MLLEIRWTYATHCKCIKKSQQLPGWSWCCFLRCCCHCCAACCMLGVGPAGWVGGSAAATWHVRSVRWLCISHYFCRRLCFESSLKLLSFSSAQCLRFSLLLLLFLLLSSLFSLSLLLLLLLLLLSLSLPTRPHFNVACRVILSRCCCCCCCCGAAWAALLLLVLLCAYTRKCLIYAQHFSLRQRQLRFCFILWQQQ